ncbi:MAG: 2-isopropylmalate synthase [Candidatus Gygaella obscura]|nr:2-isopropylmalate synthase [Candidatus Gygaella obscura]
MNNKVYIFDTTLRDGEQAPGASLNEQEKLEIAFQLERLGVDIIEAGFPISSKGDFNSVKLVASSLKKTKICALARATKKDIDAAALALKPAVSARLHVFLATSKIHMKYKLKKAEEEILRLAVESVKYAKKKFSDVEFSPEDASRTDKSFLYKVVEAVIDAGATTVNIPDTVGYVEPEEFGTLIHDIFNNVFNIHKAIVSVHCHNDLGLAVGNSLSAVKNGARQVECTINGIGERAGNAAMEEIVIAIKTRQDIFKQLKTNIDTKSITKVSRIVSKLTGFPVAPNKAIVGANAFRHESGIHQDGVLKERSTYEIIRPEDVGFKEESLVLGKHSGRHAFKERLKSLAIKLSDKDLERAFSMFKHLADKKKTVYDDDLIAIVNEQIRHIQDRWQLVSFKITSGTGLTPQAEVRLKYKNKEMSKISSGDGPVDACCKAIDKITGKKSKLLEYKLGAVTSGKDALGEVNVRVRVNKDIIIGRGTSTDVIEASIKAYLNAINKSFRA